LAKEQAATIEKRVGFQLPRKQSVPKAIVNAKINKQT